MKKYTMTCTLMFIPAMVIGMGIEVNKPLSEMEQVERMQIVRRIFINKRQNSQKMNTKRNLPADDAMSLSRSSSGSFPIDIPKVQKQDNPCFAYSLPKGS